MSRAERKFCHLVEHLLILGIIFVGLFVLDDVDGNGCLRPVFTFPMKANESLCDRKVGRRALEKTVVVEKIKGLSTRLKCGRTRMELFFIVVEWYNCSSC